jgi:hypothetical protein
MFDCDPYILLERLKLLLELWLLEWEEVLWEARLKDGIDIQVREACGDELLLRTIHGFRFSRKTKN